jgi:lysosome membrane protein 2
MGAPIAISAPHFYQASPMFTNRVNGTFADKDEHETTIYIEPWTGAVLKGAKRIQVNVQMHQFKEFEGVSKIPDGLVVPFAWIEDVAELDEKSRLQFDEALGSKIRGLKAISLAFLISGLVVFTLMIGFYMYKRTSSGARIVLTNHAMTSTRGVNNNSFRI